MGAALQGDNKWVRRGRGVGDAASYAGSGGAVRGYYGLPHQCAHWFAMTVFWRYGAGGTMWASSPTKSL